MSLVQSNWDLKVRKILENLSRKLFIYQVIPTELQALIAKYSFFILAYFDIYDKLNKLLKYLIWCQIDHIL